MGNKKEIKKQKVILDQIGEEKSKNSEKEGGRN